LSRIKFAATALVAGVVLSLATLLLAPKTRSAAA